MNTTSYNSPRCRASRAPLTLLPVAAATLLCAWLMSSCNTQGCTENRSALPLAGFYSLATDNPVMLDSLEIGGVGAPGDSLLLRRGEKTYQLYLPFRFEQSSTSFRFHYAYPEQGLDNPEFDDIVTFRYTSTPFFASEECGAYYRYTITGVDYTRHLIDSVAVLDSVITNLELERIRIYFRVAEQEGGEGL